MSDPLSLDLDLPPVGRSDVLCSSCEHGEHHCQRPTVPCNCGRFACINVATTPVAHARRTDPETSHAAAGQATRGLTEKQGAVLAVFRAYARPMTLRDVVSRYALERAAQAVGAPDRLSVPLPAQSESGLRTRVSELVRKGELRWTGRHAQIGISKHRLWSLP